MFEGVSFFVKQQLAPNIHCSLCALCEPKKTLGNRVLNFNHSLIKTVHRTKVSIRVMPDDWEAQQIQVNCCWTNAMASNQIELLNIFYYIFNYIAGDIDNRIWRCHSYRWSRVEITCSFSIDLMLSTLCHRDCVHSMLNCFESLLSPARVNARHGGSCPLGMHEVSGGNFSRWKSSLSGIPSNECILVDFSVEFDATLKFESVIIQ